MGVKRQMLVPRGREVTVVSLTTCFRQTAVGMFWGDMTHYPQGSILLIVLMLLLYNFTYHIKLGRPEFNRLQML